MRIPLDLYRILGVPIQATPVQIQQAFTDRQQQRPRQQYSSAAISARNQLLEEAYAVLSDPEMRETYDQHILANDDSEDTLGADAQQEEGMELEDHQLVGASLLLLEHGEYELVVQFGEAYLQRPIDLSRPPNVDAVSEADVILTVALGYMGLGRERWQQKQFEQAAQDLKEGLGLLEAEQLFPNIQAEIRTDLYKLRPYRILELLASPESQQIQREKGLKLLQEMLEQRGGIDGTKDDYSGLDVDNFLKFVQQLRSNLTTVEQQELFEQESQNKSAIASYLNVYALVARGFSEGKPSLIRRAKTLLDQLASRQDIYIEQAIFLLLLGQPEAATKALMLSQDQDSLDFIQKYSGEEPDLIPGLYLYTERWLQQEVYPYFRNLANQKVSLEEYFNNPQIQQMLSELSPETVEVVKTKLETMADIPPVVTEPTISVSDSTNQPQEGLTLPNLMPPTTPVSQAAQNVSSASHSASQDTTLPSQNHRPDLSVSSSSNRFNKLSTEPLSQTVEDSDSSQPSTFPRTPRRAQAPFSRGWLPWLGGVLLLILGVGGVMAMVQRCGRQDPANQISSTPSSTQSPGNTATVEASPETPDVTTPQEAGKLSVDEAKQLIQTWQSVKSEAMGKVHDSSRLQQVLADPVLSEWVRSAEAVKLSDSHWEYNFVTLNVEAVNLKGNEQATVIAQVEEKAQLYENGQLQTADSYTDNYRVQYDFLRQDKKWLIQDMKILG